LFALSCVEAASDGASVVSPEALGAFLPKNHEMPWHTFLSLNNLGLNDSHCEVMAQELARNNALSGAIVELDLTGNPSIGQQGYSSYLGY
jgi:hypothetical protein